MKVQLHEQFQPEMKLKSKVKIKIKHVKFSVFVSVRHA